MFGVMTVDAEVFPVGPIRRIVVVIAVSMMNGEEVPVFIIKLTGALGTDETMDAK